MDEDYYDNDDENRARCELDYNGGVCLALLRADGTCPVHDRAPHAKIFLDVEDGEYTGKARLGLVVLENEDR